MTKCDKCGGDHSTAAHQEHCEFCDIDGIGNHAPRCPEFLEREIEMLKFYNKSCAETIEHYEIGMGKGRRDIRRFVDALIHMGCHAADGKNAYKHGPKHCPGCRALRDMETVL